VRITEKVFARSLTLLNDLKDSQDKIDDYFSSADYYHG
jgi:hypothetical protein